MTKVSASTLQEALSKAALELECSVTELDYEVVQYESKGVLGLGKKDAIIIANVKHTLAPKNATPSNAKTPNMPTSNAQNNPQSSTQFEQNPQPHINDFAKNPSQNLAQNPTEPPKQATNQNLQNNSSQQYYQNQDYQDDKKMEDKNAQESSFFDASEFINDTKPSKSNTASYYTNGGYEINTTQTPATEMKKFQTKEEVADEITKLIQEMLSYTPYKIDNVKVSFYDNQTLSIYIDGEDSALLIGERGYRYKAISYLLFNWIQPTYGYNIRLEIAQFLQNQEDAIDAYLVGIINEVRREGRAQTKPLDGILAFIALKKLREQFPDKYISFRENPQNERYIIINDFYH
ncbi:Jag N-terminal domain-containing protein [Helicobacter sp. T3_23-1059]